jgi:hypothetical protein
VLRFLAQTQSPEPSGCEKTNSLKPLRYANKEDAIACDNPVRFLDAFVDKLQCSRQTIKTEGRPAFEHQVFLKLPPPAYLQQLSDNDKADDDLDVSYIQAKIQRLKNAKIKYKSIRSLYITSFLLI